MSLSSSGTPAVGRMTLAVTVVGICSGVQGREKIALIELFTVMGFDILITDVDAIWCGLAPT